jgi:Holliday junction DNA helicase RuvA
MIGKLKGEIDSFGEDWVILDVAGVGYEISCSPATLASLPAVGQQAFLSIETHVREDQIRLFGFRNETERAWFRLLQSVQGVGAKVALALLGTLSPQDLANAVALQDKTSITRAPGVGPKVAQRIVAELKDRIPSLTALTGMPQGAGAVGEIAALNAAAVDAVSALTNLGYGPSEASAAIAAAAGKAGEAAKAEELIRIGLKELAR